MGENSLAFESAISGAMTIIGDITRELNLYVSDPGAMIRDALSFGVAQQPDQVIRVARRGMHLIAARLPADLSADYCRRLLEVGERAWRVSNLGHERCQIGPVTLLRGVHRAVDELAGDARDVSASDSAILFEEDGALTLVLMVFGRILHEDLVFRSIAMTQRNSPTAQADLGGLHRWASYLDIHRQKDLKRLAASAPLLSPLQSWLRRAVRLEHDDLGSLLQFHDSLLGSRIDGKCYCRDPESVWTALFTEAVPVSWRSLGNFDTPQRAFIDRVVQASKPRRDVSIVNGECLIHEVVGVWDAFLTAALVEVGVDAAKRWHEGSLLKEVNSTFRAVGGVRSQAPWAANRSDPSIHAGEFDVFALTDSVLFDFQAKAPQSLSYHNRVKLPHTKALAQHRRAQEALKGGGIHLIEGSGNRSRFSSNQPLMLSANVLVHVPITVGVEYGREFGVGGSGDKALGRVTTTLDHIRLVNEFVPAVFRPVYWIYRWSCELMPMRFVNEVSFLDFWWAALCGRNPERYRTGEYVMADYEEVEHVLSVVNQIDSLDRIPREFIEIRQQAWRGLSEYSPKRTAPRVCSILDDLARRRTPGWLGVAASLMLVDIPSLEERLRLGRDFQVRTSAGILGFQMGRLPGAASRIRLENSLLRIVARDDRGWTIVPTRSPSVADHRLWMSLLVGGETAP
ncbi:hypothetical protein [Rhodococcus erythropolis]|uniref:hypothetical protein n=1 Tax=Rhodococcus erythropolis TaxID=1833 RepID=UPI001F469130|nr:hypothetical protein [Rhodococcus erythropolis]